MAQYKDSIEKLIFLHVVFLAIKVAWHYAAWALEGIEFPPFVLGMVGLEAAVLLLYNMAKLGTVKESLTLLKVFNTVQSLLAAAQVLTGWQYHAGTHNDGEPTYLYALAVAKHAHALLPSLPTDQFLSAVKAFELFMDLTLAAFVIMGTFVSHKMIVEKMEMKKEKKNIKTDREDAQKGGSDDEEDEDEGDAPAAVPLQGDDEGKVLKAAATTKTQAARRRHA
eukprot:gene4325-4578_t